MPQTLLAFIGASGRSVKIVCRGELFGGGLPVEEEDIKRFHLNLYEKARMVYNAQLGLCPSTLSHEKLFQINIKHKPLIDEIHRFYIWEAYC